MAEAEANGFRLMVLASLGLHVAAGAVLASGSFFEPRPFFPGERIIEVKMVSMPDTPEAAPAPAPRKPPPPPPPEEKVLIPEQPRPLKEKKREPEPEPPREDPPPPQETEPEYDLGSALDALRDEMGEPEPDAEPIDGAPAAAVSGNQVADRDLVRWVSQVKRRVKSAWVLAPGFKSQSLSTDVEVLLSANGTVMGVEIVRRSGNPWFDESVERALHAASPLPAPPDAGGWPFSFDPKDAR
jgi:TonB family protein